MKKNYKLNKIIILSILVLSSLNIANAQFMRCNEKIDKQEIVQVARTNLKDILNLIDSDDLEAYGFKPGDNFSEIIIGTPFIKTNIEIQDEGGYKLRIQSSNVPLILNNEIKCFAVLTNETGNWLPVGIGGANWAKENNELLLETALNSTYCNVIIQKLDTGEQFLINNCSSLISLQPVNGVRYQMVQMEHLIMNK